MSDAPRVPTIMGELLQDPAVLEWLQARDLQAYERGWDRCLDTVIETARTEGASAALLTALNEVGSLERIRKDAERDLVDDGPPPRVRVPMEQTEA